GGLGLGLTIVKTLIEKHGGTVHAESRGLAHGSEFVVRMPLVELPTDADAAAPEGTVRAASRSERILVVDDNEDAAEMLEAALTQLGYRVTVAHDGPTALQLSERVQPDFALLDIGLPVMDGYELAERLRAQRGDGRLVLIAISGYGQERDRERSEAAGFDRHLVKPIQLNELEQALSHAGFHPSESRRL